MSVYGVVGEHGKNAFFNRARGSVISVIERVDCGNYYGMKISTNFPFTFEEKPKNSFVFFSNQAGAKVSAKPSYFDWYEESQLPQLIQHSFDLLAIEFRSRSAHEWRKHSESLFEMLLELNTTEKVLLLDYEAINFSAFSRPVFRMQAALEYIKSLRN